MTFCTDKFTTGDTVSLGVSLVLLEIPDEAWIRQVLVTLLDLTSDEENWNDKLGAVTAEAAAKVFSLILQTVQFDYEIPMSIPVGAMLEWTVVTAPAGWLLCDGASYLRATYPDLFGTVGTTFGAVDGTHFNVPDMRNRSPMGIGPTFLTNIGQAAGNLEHTLNNSEMPTHNHGVNDPGHGHRGRWLATAATGGAAGDWGSATAYNQGTGTVIEPSFTGISTQNNGDGQPHTILHPVLGVEYIIKAIAG